MTVATKEEILEGILALPVLDVSWLVKQLEEEFGVSAVVPMAAATGAPAGGDAGGAAIDDAQTLAGTGLESFHKIAGSEGRRAIGQSYLKESGCFLATAGSLPDAPGWRYRTRRPPTRPGCE